MRYNCIPTTGNICQCVTVRCSNTAIAANISLAQYNVILGTYTSDQLLNLSSKLNYGSGISLNSDQHTITLQPGYVYQVFYDVNSITPTSKTMTISPTINGALQSLYSSTATTETSTETLSLDNSFSINAASTTTLTFALTTPKTASVAVTGNIYIVQLRPITT